VSTYQLNKAVYTLTRTQDRASFNAQSTEYFADFDLNDDERQALTRPDFCRLGELGLLSNLLYRYFAFCGYRHDDFHAMFRREGAAALKGAGHDG